MRIKLHHEPRLFPAYDLIVSSGGPKLKASADPDAPDARRLPPKTGPDGFPEFPPGHGERIALTRGFHAKFQNYTMPEFVGRLIDWVTPKGDPPHYVLYKTGLTGVYDFTLKFDDGGRAAMAGPGARAAMVAQEAMEPGSGLPDIFKALEQQLGLKLVKAKDAPLDTIIIDRAERIPRGN